MSALLFTASANGRATRCYNCTSRGASDYDRGVLLSWIRGDPHEVLIFKSIWQDELQEAEESVIVMRIFLHSWMHMVALMATYVHISFIMAACYGCIWMHMSTHGCTHGCMLWLHMDAYVEKCE